MVRKQHFKLIIDYLHEINSTQFQRYLKTGKSIDNLNLNLFRTIN